MMSVEWRKDLKSGELFPVFDDSDFEVPAHLQEAEYNSIDYDKTKEVTIMQLQEQLTSAQEQIKIMTANPVVEPVFDDIVIENKTELESESDTVTKSHDFFVPFLIVVIFLCMLIFGIFFNFYNKSNVVEDTTEQIQYVEEVSEEQGNVLAELSEEIYDILPTVLIVFITVSCVRIGIKILHSTISGC